MREEWRDIKDYEGIYQISNRGNVKSLNYRRTGKERILKGSKDSNGYLQVHLCKDGKMKAYCVHRLVASAFLENPMGYTDVNHKDENKENNCIENLEWCSRLYNNTYNGRAKRIGKKRSKPIIGFDKVLGLIVKFSSAHEAEVETGIASSHITACCKGKRKSAGGYIWQYLEDDKEVANG